MGVSSLTAWPMMEPGRGFHKAASLPRRLVGRDLARRSMVLLEMKLHSVVLALFVSLVVTGCGHHKHHRAEGGGRAPGWFRKRRLSQLSGRCSATVKIVVITSTATVIAKRVRRAGASKRRER